MEQLNMQTNGNSHIVRFNEELETVEIYRIHSDSSEVFLTRISFEQAEKKGFETFASALGEALLLDSPTARKIFRL
jgi:hypothetical protein